MIYRPDDNQNSLSQKGFKYLHLAGTFWFILCIGFILVKGLLEAGLKWWQIFPLSGHYVVILFVLVSLYLFALFRGGKPAEGHTIEHPLTTSDYYLILYIGAPLLGALSGLLHAALYKQTTNEFLQSNALATLAVTFASWIIVDPILASVETFTPQGLAQRKKRFGKQREERLKKQKHRDALLELLIQKEKENEALWSQTLTCYVPELCDLLNTTRSDFNEAEKRAAEIAIEAWRLGGLSCMQFLHKKTLMAYTENHPNRLYSDYIIDWWDGIGAWRNPSAV
jgi:hypothetical protein